MCFLQLNKYNINKYKYHINTQINNNHKINNIP